MQVKDLTIQKPQTGYQQFLILQKKSPNLESMQGKKERQDLKVEKLNDSKRLPVKIKLKV